MLDVRVDVRSDLHLDILGSSRALDADTTTQGIAHDDHWGSAGRRSIVGTVGHAHLQTCGGLVVVWWADLNVLPYLTHAELADRSPRLGLDDAGVAGGSDPVRRNVPRSRSLQSPQPAFPCTFGFQFEVPIEHYCTPLGRFRYHDDRLPLCAVDD